MKFREKLIKTTDLGSGAGAWVMFSAAAGAVLLTPGAAGDIFHRSLSVLVV